MNSYQAALTLVTRLDTHLWYGTAHFYTTEGKYIWTLDQAINAILSGNFAGTVPPKREREPLPSSVRVPRWLVGEIANLKVLGIVSVGETFACNGGEDLIYCRQLSELITGENKMTSEQKKQQIARIMKMQEMIKKDPKDWNREEMEMFHEAKERKMGSKWHDEGDNDID